MHAESKTASMTASPVIKVTEQRARRRQRNVRDRQTEIERGRQCRRQRRHTSRRTHALGHAARISCVLFSVSVHPNGRQVNVPTAMVLTRPKFKIIAAPQRWEFEDGPTNLVSKFIPQKGPTLRDGARRIGQVRICLLAPFRKASVQRPPLARCSARGHEGYRPAGGIMT